ncbi:hypothetical protein Q2941_49150 [Bradyrhizobium sp. UFLA05-153]
MQRDAALLAQAQRLLMMLGGSGWTTQACHDIGQFAAKYDLLD